MQAPLTFPKPKEVPLEALAWLIVQRRDPHMGDNEDRVTSWPRGCRARVYAQDTRDWDVHLIERHGGVHLILIVLHVLQGVAL
jgi:hypothetical protein